MGITPQQITLAAALQEAAAKDTHGAVRLIAGPGTGKSHSIEQRVDWLLDGGMNPSRIYVISFTRASFRELGRRIVSYCTANGRASAVQAVHVSTMHSLALSTLRRANLLTMFPARPMILDDWEQSAIFDAEFSTTFNCTPTRAKEIRVAYDAYWQTLQDIQLHEVTPQEQQRFVAFHSERTTQYSCMLAGEIVRRCVDAMRNGVLNPQSLMSIEHLIVDEFQDLNACDQEFVQRIHAAGAKLWLAGDDDQSIYLFRHAEPSGIRNFETTYPDGKTHELNDCFRCTPAVLGAATTLVSVNPSRLQKNLTSLYEHSEPPIVGRVQVWRFNHGETEARAIAESCRELRAAGIEGEEILILIANRKAQLRIIEQALEAAGVPLAAPRGPALAETDMGRLLLALLRIVSDNEDYTAHRTLLGLQRGVGVTTCLEVANLASAQNLNFLDLFYGAYPDDVFSSRASNAIERAKELFLGLGSWEATDQIGTRDAEIQEILGAVYGVDAKKGQEAIEDWQALRSQFPDGMTLEELLGYVWSDSEVEQLRILQGVQARLGVPQSAGASAAERVRILTMHSSKGLSGKVVFIPGFEQEFHPGRRALSSPGLVQERRRLLYVSISRAKVACYLSLAGHRSGGQAQAMGHGWDYDPAPSQFLTDINLPAVQRTGGLSDSEIAEIVDDCNNL